MWEYTEHCQLKANLPQLHKESMVDLTILHMYINVCMIHLISVM